MPVSKGYFFIHIPRTGGTLCEEEFLDIKGQWPIGQPDKLWGILSDGKRNFTAQHLTWREAQAFPVIRGNQPFTIVRNPFTRAMSLYKYWGGVKKWGSLEHFLEVVRAALNGVSHPHVETYHVLPQFDYLCDFKGQLIPCTILSFETYVEDFQTYFGFQTSFNHQRHQNHRFSQREAELIRDIYKKDFQFLGYSMCNNLV